ncbi:MAG TPA: crosslink repair DNA glycosylase YcaQ family protein [Mycobacteriales bacterium]
MSLVGAEGLSLGEARRVAVGAGGLTTGFGDVTTALERLAVVQLDAINAVARAHQLTLAARVTGLTAMAVDEVLWGRPDRSVAFEYPAHAAALVPITDWPLWAFRMRRTRTAELDWRPEPTVRARLVAAITDQGPLTMRQLRGQDRAGNGWDWGPTKTAVEYLVWSGELACVRRQGWHRVFDLPERVIPSHLLDQNVDDHTCLVRLLTRAGRALGVATVDDLADYPRIGKDRVLATVGDTPLRPVHVRGWKQQTWAHPDALSMLDSAPPTRARFVGPFDNLVWYRRRIGRLFDFNHVLEAYKPAARRQYGYYALPLLVGTRLVGRCDMAVEGDTLRVLALSVDPAHDVPAPRLREAFAALMRATATTRLTGVDD